MIVIRLKLPLDQAEYSALLKVSQDELRNPVDQARFILRQELERRGLVPTNLAPLVTEPPEHDHSEAKRGTRVSA